VLITALLLQKVSSEAGIEGGNTPAVQQCTFIIDEILASKEMDRRTLMTNRIQIIRQRFTKKVSKTPLHTGLCAAMELLGSDFFKSKPGTRFDFLRQNFRENEKNMRDLMPVDEAEFDIFKKELKAAILSI
jgi:hypothetical protein